LELICYVYDIKLDKDIKIDFLLFVRLFYLIYYKYVAPNQKDISDFNDLEISNLTDKMGKEDISHDIMDQSENYDEDYIENEY
jgi:hypothetical protein